MTGASAATIWSLMPLNKVNNLVSASLAFCTLSAASFDITTPRVSASANIALRPSLPSARVFTNAAPSESNSLNASASFSASGLASEKASDRASILSLNGILTNALASKPSSFNAAFASPVPFAASAVRLVKRCNAISIVVADTPVKSAAYLSLLNSSVVVPILDAVLARASVV